MWISLHPVLSCYLRLRYKMQYLFSSSDTVLWHSSVSRERSQTYSQSTVLTHTLQQKIAMAVTHVFKTSGLKAKKKKKNLQCFLPCFLIGGMTKQDWDLNSASPAWQHVSPSGPSKARGRRFYACCLFVAWWTLITFLLYPAFASSSSPKFEK